jgi:hypothetical protein
MITASKFVSAVILTSVDPATKQYQTSSKAFPVKAPQDKAVILT